MVHGVDAPQSPDNQLLLGQSNNIKVSGDAVAEVIPMWTPETLGDLEAIANHDLSLMRLPLGEFLKRHFKNYSTNLYYTIQLLNLYFNNNNNKEEDREEEEFIKWCMRNSYGSKTADAVAVILDRKAVTSKEVEIEAKISAQFVNQLMEKIGRFGLVESGKTVSAGYVNQPGRPPAIFQTSEASPEDINAAEKRYAVIALGYDPDEQRREFEKQRQEAELKRVEDDKRRQKESKQRLIQFYENLINEIIMKQSVAFLEGESTIKVLCVYRDEYGKELEKTENPQPKDTMQFLSLIEEAYRRVKQEGKI